MFNFMRQIFTSRKTPWLVALGLLFASLYSMSSFGQTNGYTFSATSGTYTPITGGTVVLNNGADDTWSSSVSIPFTFTYNGNAYTNLFVQANGYVAMGGALAPTNSYTPISATNSNVIVPFGGDGLLNANFTANRTLGDPVLTAVSNVRGIAIGSTLSGTGIPVGATVVSKTATTLTMSAGATSTGTGGTVTAAGEARVETLGSSPNRIFVVQWLNNRRSFSSAGASRNFQLRLFETTNVVQFVYGDCGVITSQTCQIGLKGNSAVSTDWNNVSSTTSFSAPTQPGASNAATMTISSTVFPNPGQTYTWTPPSCQAPGTPVVSGLSNNSATVTWTAGGGATSYDWELRTGSSCSGGVVVQSGTGFAGLSQTFSGTLVSNTQYVFCVRSNCPGPTQSAASSVVFTTACDPFSIPFTENFESMGTVGSGVYPSCWTDQSLTGTGRYTTSNTTIDGVGAYAGTRFVHIAWSNDDWLFTPPLSLSAGVTYYFSYYYRHSRADGVDFVVNNRVGTAASSAAMAAGTNLNTITMPATGADAWLLNVSSFTPVTSGTYYFGVRTTAGGAPWYMLYDNFEVSTTSPCGAPSALNNTALGTTTASFNWTAGPGASSYDWELRTSGACGSGSPVQSGSAAGTTLNLTSLSPATAYTLCIRSNCGGPTSAWISTSFNTLCNPVSLPLTEGFSASTPLCWTNSLVAPATKQWQFFNVTSDGATVNDGHFAQVFWTPSGTGVLITPAMDFTTLGGPQAILRFKVYRDGSGTSDTIAAWINTAPTFTGASAQRLLRIPRSISSAPVEASAGWYTYSVNIPASYYTSGNVYVLFKGTISSAWSVSMDDVYIGPPPPTTLGTLTIEQNPTGVSNVGAGSSNNTVLRINMPVDSTTGTLTLNSLVATYTGTSTADIAASGVRLFRTTGPTFTSPVQVGSAVSLSGSTATFSGLGYNLRAGNNYFWVTADITGTATEGNSVDFSIASGAINISASGGAAAPGTQPAALADPTGNRLVVGNLKYVFSQSSVPYVENTDAGRTILPEYPLDTWGDDYDEIVYLGGGVYNATTLGATITGTGLPIGFTFNYNGTNFTGFGLSTNGFIKLGNGTFSITNSLSSALSTTTGEFSSIIAPFHRDMESYANGEISYQTTGTAPNRKLTIQWKNFRVFASTDLFNFQIILNETSNVIDFAYEVIPFQIRTVMSGIKGNRLDVDLSNISSRTRTITTQVPLTLDVDKTTVSGSALTFNAPTNFQLTDVVQTYTPTTCGLGIPTLNSFTLVTNNSAQANWPVNATASGYQIRWRLSTDDFTVSTWATPVYVAGSGNNFYNITGLGSNATYIVEVRNMCSPTSGAGWSPAATVFTDPASVDLEAVAIIQPTIFQCYSAAQTVRATFRNVGLGPISANTIIFLRVNVNRPVGGPAVLNLAYSQPTPINVGDVITATFPTLDMTNPGTYTFNTDVPWASDGNSVNNTLLTPVSIFGYTPIVPSPTYSIGLNGSVPNGSLFTSTIAPLNPFAFGGPGAIDLDGIASITPQEGTGALVFQDQFFDNATVRYITPCISISSCYELRFWHSRYSGQNNTRGTQIRVSTDGGTTFSAPLTLTNLSRGKTGNIALQYLATAATPEWDEFSADLGAYVGQNVRIAFEALVTTGTSSNWVIDNIRVTPKNVRDVALQGVVSGISYATCNPSTIPVSARVVNYGCGPASGFTVNVTVTGPVVGGTSSVGATFTGSLAEGASVDVPLGNVLLTGNGTLTFTGSVAFTGDVVPANNTMTSFQYPLRNRPASTLTLSNANVVVGNSATINGSVSLGSGSALFSASPNLNIPDNNVTGVTSQIVVSSLPPATLASSIEGVSVIITHPQVGDLRVRLRAPGGTTINLVNRRGGTGNDFVNTRFRSGPLISAITAAGAPYTGTFEPEEPFTTFGAALANGTWELIVDDNAAQDIGTLVYWSLELPNQLNTASWTCLTCPSGFPVNFTAPIGSIAYPNNPFGAAYPAGSYTITLGAADASGCVLTRDTTVNFFTTNTWLGVTNIPAGNNWINPANWLATPAPPTSTVAVTIPNGTPFAPSISGSATVGSMTLAGGTSINFTNPAAVLNVVANWEGGANAPINGPGRVLFNGSAGQVITGNTIFQNVEISKTSGSVSINGSATIKGLLTFNPANTAPLNVGGPGRLILFSDASSTAKIGPVPAATTISGNVTMQRYIPGTVDGWHFLGSPILGRNFTDWADNFKVYGPASGYGSQGGGIIPLSADHTTIFEYRDNVHNVVLDTVQRRGWRAPANTSIENGRGYRVWIDRSSMYQTNKFDNFGPVAQQGVTFPQLNRNEFVTCQQATTPSNDIPCNENWRGWNLLSNPYPCDIDWDATGGAWTKPAQMVNAFYRYNTIGLGGPFGMAGYGIYIPGLGWSGSTPAPANPNLIPSSQGFFVKLGVAGTYNANLSVTEAAKVTTSSAQFLRVNTVIEKIRIKMSRSLNPTAYGYDAVVRFMEGATDGLDFNMDFDNMSGPGFHVAIPVESNQLVVASYAPLTDSKIVPLVTEYNGNFGTYFLRFAEMDALLANNSVYLRDNLLGTMTEITPDLVYTYSVSATDGIVVNRFELVFSPSAVTSVNPSLVGGKGLGVYPNPNVNGSSTSVSIVGMKAVKALLTVIDAVGKVVFTKEVAIGTDGQRVVDFKMDVPAGLYTVKVSGGDQTMVKKLVIK